jgi:hypothetical protein
MSGNKHTETYRTLGITKAMETAVIEYLASERVLATCYTPGSASCMGDCPAGQHCITTTTGNCVCSNDS